MCRIVATILLVQTAYVSVADENVPNILWITAEDMSPILGCYGDTYATTPHIDRLAKHSVRYTRAFATAPVCSPVRSCLITGCYPTTLGTHNMRSAMPLPPGIRGFPAILREAGYFTTNNVKTDYNTSDESRLIKESWDQSSDKAHWRNRKQTSQPFFSVVNLMTSHQSRTMVWPYEKFQAEIQSILDAAEIHDPAVAPIPVYYPDTAVVRRDWARMYDCVTAMDKQVGDLLQQLEEDGLQDSTIVFFFSDHGAGMPRHKRTLLDSGMHVPLLVRFPKMYQHWAPTLPGESTDELVSFVDFPTTVLLLANQPSPAYMQGQPFLGTDKPAERKYVFGHRDRVDEAFDCARSIRSQRYLYIRNFMPHLSYNQPTAWPDQGELRHEFYRLANRETMTDAQWQFAGPSRPVEELYDCQNDPLNLNNLATSAQHATMLQNMRHVLNQHLSDTADCGFVPESMLQQSLLTRGRLPGFAEGSSDRGAAAVFEVYRRHAANVGFQNANFHQWRLKQAPPWYWDAVALRYHASLSQEAEGLLRSRMAETSGDAPSMAARIELAHALVHHRDDRQALAFLIEATASPDLNVVLHATRTIQLLGSKADTAVPAIRKVSQRCQSLLPTETTATFVQNPEQDLAMFIGFSANAILEARDSGQ